MNGILILRSVSLINKMSLFILTMTAAGAAWKIITPDLYNTINDIDCLGASVRRTFFKAKLRLVQLSAAKVGEGQSDNQPEEHLCALIFA